MRIKIVKNPHLGDPHPTMPIWGGLCGCWGVKRGGDHDVLIIVGGISREAKKQGIAYKLICVGTGPKAIDDDGDGPIWLYKERYKHWGIDGPDVRENYPALAALMYPGCRAPRVYDLGGGNPALDRELKRLMKSAPAPQWGKRGVK